MKKEIIKLLHENNFILCSDNKIFDLSGGYIGIHYDNTKKEFSVFAKRNIYYSTKEDIENIKKELDKKFCLINELNQLIKS
jgi:hypothetical protein